MQTKSDFRPQISGKFLKLGEDKFYIRGVTYGTFKPRVSGEEYPEPEIVERDFEMMATYGFNAIRTYSPPPRWLLDIAAKHHLYVMVGLPMERYTGYLTERIRPYYFMPSAMKSLLPSSGGMDAEKLSVFFIACIRPSREKTQMVW